MDGLDEAHNLINFQDLKLGSKKNNLAQLENLFKSTAHIQLLSPHNIFLKQ